MRMRSLLPAPDSCESRGQAGSVNGGRRPSAEQTRSAIDGAGMDRTLPAAGAGITRLTSFMPLPFETPRPADNRQAMPQAGAITESGETAVDNPSCHAGAACSASAMAMLSPSSRTSGGWLAGTWTPGPGS